MSDAELLTYLGTDAAKWAAEFCKRARDHGHTIDEGWMIGWFANAIEHARATEREELARIGGPLCWLYSDLAAVLAARIVAEVDAI